jgi:hypothetical protein
MKVEGLESNIFRFLNIFRKGAVLSQFSGEIGLGFDRILFLKSLI